MLLFFSIGLAAIPLLLTVPFVLIECGCGKKKKKAGPKGNQPPAPTQGAKPPAQGAKPPGPGVPPGPGKPPGPGMPRPPPAKPPAAAGKPPFKQPTTTMQMQPQLVTLPDPHGGTPTLFLMQPSAQPGGTPTIIQMPPGFASTIQALPAPAKPSEEKKPASPSKEDPKTTGDKEDLYEDISSIATAIINDNDDKNGSGSKRDKKNGSGSKRATTESAKGDKKGTVPDLPDEKQQQKHEGMADQEQYQTLADLNVDAVFTKK